MADFEISTKFLPEGIALVEVRGYLDAHTFEIMENAVDSIFKKGIYKIIANLSKLTYISSAGAGVFIGATGQAQEGKGNIVLFGLTPGVREVFDLLGLSQIFTIVEDERSALKVFDGNAAPA